MTKVADSSLKDEIGKMKQHSYFSNCQERDLVKFDKNHILEIRSLKYSFEKIFSNLIEAPFIKCLESLGIQTFKGTYIEYPNGKRKTHYNQWFNQGVACEILCLDEGKWKTGKIKVRVSVEFYPDEEKEKGSDLMAELDDFDEELTLESINEELKRLKT